MFVASYSVTCIYVPGKPGVCFHYYCTVYDECKYADTFWFADRTRLFVQYTISLSSLWKTYLKALNWNACQIYIVECVSKNKHILSVIHLYNMWGCMFSAYPFPLWWMIEYIYTLSYYHHQIGSANYYPLFRVRSWSNGVRCMSCYILTKCLGYQFYLKPLMFHTPTSHKWNCIYIFRGSVCRTISIETSKSAVHGDFVPKRPPVVFEKKRHLFSHSIFSWHT